jgi:hypothetical protein
METDVTIRHLHRSHQVPIAILAHQFGISKAQVVKLLGRWRLRGDELNRRRWERMKLELRLTQNVAPR